jgi:hypothetical protein
VNGYELPRQLWASDCCALCQYEGTCGYSPLNVYGKRLSESYIPCSSVVVSGKSYFEPKRELVEAA